MGKWILILFFVFPQNVQSEKIAVFDSDVDCNYAAHRNIMYSSEGETGSRSISKYARCVYTSNGYAITTPTRRLGDGYAKRDKNKR